MLSDQKPIDTTVTLDVAAALDWIGLLHGDSPGLVHLASTGDWQGKCFPPSDDQGIRAYIERADGLGRPGIYLRMTTLTKPPGPGERGKVTDSASITGFWADIDIAGPGHKDEGNLPPDEAACYEIVEASGLPTPSLWVHSGGGMYPLWLLSQPHVFAGEEDIRDWQHMSEAWHRCLGRAAESLGWKYGTGVHDLARILRVPGTVNRKPGMAEPRPCLMVEASGRAFTPEEFREALMAVAPPPAPAPTPVAPTSFTALRDRIRATTPGDVSPLDDFEARTEWSEILEPQGWQVHSRSGTGYNWTRPGKETRDGMSATTGQDPTRDRMFCFSTAAGLPTYEPMTKGFVYSQLHHGGDMRAAATDLRRQGYGDGPRAADPVAVTEAKAFMAPGFVPPVPATNGHHPAGAPGTETPSVPAWDGRQVDIGGRAAIGNLIQAIRDGALGGVYTRAGKLVHLTAAGPDAPSQAMDVRDVTPQLLLRLAGAAIDTVKFRAGKDDDQGKYVSAVPTLVTLSGVLTERDWAPLPELVDVIYAPTIAADGTVTQTPGFNPATKVYLQPQLRLAPVADVPGVAEVAEARRFVLEELIVDFPFRADADRANFVGLLMAPLLRGYLNNCLTPLGVLSAPSAGTGKSLLAELVSRLYGADGSMDLKQWTDSEEEMRKTITTSLRYPSPVTFFDNIAQGSQVGSAVLASLITSRSWSDRLLGGNESVTLANRRLWLVTGNGLRIGDDMRDRCLLVDLDPRMPNPAMRKGFHLGQLSVWLDDPANRAKALRSLIVLARDWILAGAPRGDYPMRQFQPWTDAMAGLTAHHGIPGFGDNRDEMGARDEKAGAMGAFAVRWWENFATTPLRTVDLLKTLDGEGTWSYVDRWSGTFPMRGNGQKHNYQSLGMLLRGHRDTYLGGEYRLVGELDPHTKGTWWHLEKVSLAGETPPTEDES